MPRELLHRPAAIDHVKRANCERGLIARQVDGKRSTSFFARFSLDEMRSLMEPKFIYGVYL
jgi:hypothetical protein